MGLDAYAYAVPKEDVINDTAYRGWDTDTTEWYYWRKNWGLQDWLTTYFGLYHIPVKSGGLIRLTMDDLNALELAILTRQVPYNKYEKGAEWIWNIALQDIRFAAEAKLRIRYRKQAIYYYSDW